MKKNPSSPPKRSDALANEEKVRKALVAFIRKHKRPPTTQELCTATGLTDKTVKQHRQRIPLGAGKDNIYQQLSSDVLMAVHARAVGYSHRAVKIISRSIGNNMGSEIEEVPYTEHYAPDPASAKLWFQLVEGFTEKSEKKVSGEVGLSLKFNYVAPAPPVPDGGN